MYIQPPPIDTLSLTNDLHCEDGLRVGWWLTGLLLLLELGEGAEDEGEGGQQHHAQARPGEHLTDQG